jgi:hypothetical protein
MRPEKALPGTLSATSLLPKPHPVSSIETESPAKAKSEQERMLYLAQQQGRTTIHPSVQLMSDIGDYRWY